MNDPEADRELRERLRAADPARHLSRPRMLELTEATMSTSPTPSRRDRTRLLVAAAAAAVVAAAGIGLAMGDGDDDPVAKPRSSPTKALSTSTYTLAAGGSAARCMTPDQNGIRQLDVAFVGKVTGRSDDEIKLTPSTFYTGPKSDRVVLDVKKAEGAIYEVLPVKFEVGKEYVVAIEQGQVRLCGFTAEANPGLTTRYEQALR